MAVKGAIGQTVSEPLAAPYAGLGAYSMHCTDAFSMYSNVAALANTPGFSAGLYAERRFLLKELSAYQASVVFPVHKKDGGGITASYFGFNQYNQSQVSLGYGKKLGKIDLGVQLGYATRQVAGYGSDKAVQVAMGLRWQLTRQLVTGLQVINPAGGQWSKSPGEPVVRVYKMGWGYELSDQLLLCAELGKEENKPLNVVLGVQYIAATHLLARAGLSAGGAGPYGSLGWLWDEFQVSVAASYHPQLGITPGLQLVFKGKQQEAQP